MSEFLCPRCGLLAEPHHSLEACVKLLKGRLASMNARHRWRPIAEIHEDYGPCILMNIEDPGYLEIGNCTNTDWGESQWSHFSQITSLTCEEAEEMLGSALNLCPSPSAKSRASRIAGHGSTRRVKTGVARD